jgi:hypothetical protein
VEPQTSVTTQGIPVAIASPIALENPSPKKGWGGHLQSIIKHGHISIKTVPDDPIINTQPTITIKISLSDTFQNVCYFTLLSVSGLKISVLIPVLNNSYFMEKRKDLLVLDFTRKRVSNNTI